LHGIPFSVKDVFLTKGTRTTFGSKLYAENVPDEDAPTVARLRAAGGILVGKTNTPAFGLLGSTRNLLFETTRNPWDTGYSPGGSSGGAAAAVAARLGPLAVGTDSGGSVRIPASFCGVVGLKPSFGRVPLYPAALLHDHAGPITRTVADAALALDVLAGPDDRDFFSWPANERGYSASLLGDLKGLRIAWSPTLGHGPVDPEVRRLCESAAFSFKAFGCQVEEANPSWPDLSRAKRITYFGALAGKLAPYLPERADDIDPELRAAIDEAMAWSASQHAQAWDKALAFCNEVQPFFMTYDLLLTPSVACPPYRVDLDGPATVAGQHITEFYSWAQFSYPFNITGQPAISIPCGFTNDLPVGLQIVGRRFHDATVLRAAACFEQSHPWAERYRAIE
jgi:Asp-tRNA(Asn)/Glu-tRNA(Gln) amidotransferase A subunit family amidase